MVCGAGALQTRRQSVSLQLSRRVWWPQQAVWLWSEAGAGGQGPQDTAATVQPCPVPRHGPGRAAERRGVAPPEDALAGLRETELGGVDVGAPEGCIESGRARGQRCRGGCQPPQPRAEEGAEPSESFLSCLDLQLWGLCRRLVSVKSSEYPCLRISVFVD